MKVPVGLSSTIRLLLKSVRNWLPGRVEADARDVVE